MFVSVLGQLASGENPLWANGRSVVTGWRTAVSRRQSTRLRSAVGGSMISDRQSEVGGRRSAVSGR